MPYDRKYSTTAKGRARRGPAMGRRRPKSAPAKSKALTKTEKKQVATIAKAVVKSTAESKYFNCNLMVENDRDVMFRATASTPNEIYVKGYQLENISAGGALPLQYGVDTAGLSLPMDNLNMATVQTTGDNKREGSYVTPSLCKTEWLLRRDTTLADENNNTRDGASAYRVRIVRVCPRQVAGTPFSLTDAINPRANLFVNERGDAVGIEDNLNADQIELYRINTRKYKVILDKFINVLPSISSALVASGSGGAPGDVNAPFQINNVPGKMVMTHDIGKKLYYAEDADVKPTAGLKEEFILYHAYFPTRDGRGADPEDLKISVKSVSTFKDL